VSNPFADLVWRCKSGRKIWIERWQEQTGHYWRVYEYTLAGGPLMLYRTKSLKKAFRRAEESATNG
jgi:hypothetical protein